MCSFPRTLTVHKDHSKAFMDIQRAGLDICMSKGTAEALGAQGHRIHVVKAGDPLVIGSWVIKPLDMQHDAAEPLGFLIAYKPTGEKLVYATDTFYLKYSFSGVNYWLVECNYCTDRLMYQYEHGEVEMGLYRRLLQSHMSLEHLKDYLMTQPLKQARKIVLLHLSDARSDEKRMVDEISELTGIETVAAKAGLSVELEQYPF